MAFCPKCGRQVPDGQVCNCQQVAPGQAAPQMAPQQPSQFNQQVNQFANAASAQANVGMGQLTYFFKQLFSHPYEAVAEYVKAAPVAGTIILSVVLALISACEYIFYMFERSIDSTSYKFTFKVFAKGFFSNFFSVVVGVALFAILYMVLVNAFEKKENNSITFFQGLSTASLVYLFQVPFGFVGQVLDLVNFNFFSYLNGWLTTFGQGVSLVLVFFAMKALQKSNDKMPLVYACSITLVAVSQTIISFMF